MSQNIDTITQEIKKVELTIFNVRKEIKSTKKKFSDYKKNFKKDRKQKRDRTLKELNTLNAKIAAYKQFCEQLSNIESADKDDIIKQAEKLLFK